MHTVAHQEGDRHFQLALLLKNEIGGGVQLEAFSLVYLLTSTELLLALISVRLSKRVAFQEEHPSGKGQFLRAPYSLFSLVILIAGSHR